MPLGQVQRRQIMLEISSSIGVEQLGKRQKKMQLVVDPTNLHLCHFFR